MKHDIILHLGSNMGDRNANLTWAMRLLVARFSSPIYISSTYETEAWGPVAQNNFYNVAVGFRTNWSVQRCHQYTQQIEHEIGAPKTVRWGPREIDVDILFYDDIILNSQNLTVPHPRLHQRGFVLAPLVEIIPHYRHPQLKRSIEELYLSLDDPLFIEVVGNLT